MAEEFDQTAGSVGLGRVNPVRRPDPVVIESFDHLSRLVSFRCWWLGWSALLLAPLVGC